MTTRTKKQPVASEVLDRETLQRAQNGDEQAFARLVEIHETSIRRVAGSLVPRDLVDDMVQDILLKVHRNLHRFDLDRSERLRSWLLVLARNLCLDELRRPQRPLVPLDDLEFDIESNATTPLADLMHQEQTQQLIDHLETLPAWYRDAFRQRCLEGSSYEQIANRAQITRAAARTRVGRARHQLRLHMEEALQVA